LLDLINITVPIFEEGFSYQKLRWNLKI